VGAAKGWRVLDWYKQADKKKRLGRIIDDIGLASSRRNWVCRRSDLGFQFRWLPSNWFPRLQTSWVTLSLPRSSEEALGILPEFVTPGGGPWLIAALNPSTSSRLGTLVFVKLLLRKVASGQWLVIRKKCSPPSSLSVLLGKVPVGAVRFKSFS